MEKDLLFYDIEVFKHDVIIVFKNIEKEMVKIFHNDFTGLWELIKDKRLVGYNNHYYDDKILTGILRGFTQSQIKLLNDQLINNTTTQLIRWTELDSLDCFQQIDVSMPSLKRVEGNLGKSIIETAVDFNINRPLTPDELQLEIDYCSYDVDSIIEIYNLRKDDYFKAKDILLTMLPEDKQEKFKKRNTTSISSNILLENKLPSWATLRIPQNMMDMVPVEVAEMWEQGNLHGDNVTTKKVIIEKFDNVIEFGWGGLHGAPKKTLDVDNIFLLDVTSMYPNIILNLNILGHASEKYKSILEERLAVKHTNKTLSDALKIVVNSVYGNLRNEYMTVYNRKAQMAVCVYGQIALYNLCERLAQYVDIININTDGVAFRAPHDTKVMDYIKDIVKDWEEDFKLNLELEKYSRWIQKDVNNYIAIPEYDLEYNNKFYVDVTDSNSQADMVKNNVSYKEVKMTLKGADVNKYYKDKVFSNNNARVEQIATVDYLVFNKSILDTLVANLDQPYLFQYIVQGGRSYVRTCDIYGKELQKVNRVFASKHGDYYLYKEKADGSRSLFPSTPDKQFIYNGDCFDKRFKESFYDKIDLQHYLNNIKIILKRWK